MQWSITTQVFNDQSMNTWCWLLLPKTNSKNKMSSDYLGFTRKNPRKKQIIENAYRWEARQKNTVPAFFFFFVHYTNKRLPKSEYLRYVHLNIHALHLSPFPICI